MNESYESSCDQTLTLLVIYTTIKSMNIQNGDKIMQIIVKRL